MLEKTIKNLGFSDKEARIYLACLELGNALVSSIARNSGENRITVYNILKDMKTRGIAQELTKNNTKYFSVIEPQALLKKEKEKVKQLETIMPELLAISNAFPNKPKVYFYEGIDGLIEIYKDLLTSKTDIKAFLGVNSIKNKKFLDYGFNEFLPKRIKADIWAKVIIPDNKKDVEYKNEDIQNKRESITIDKNIFKMKNEINIYGEDKIAISLFSENEVGGLIIKSTSLHESLSSIFNLVWLAYKK